MAYIDLPHNIKSWIILSWLTSSYALVFVSIACALFVLYRKKRAPVLSPPSVPGHWFFKNQKLLQAPWRGVLMAEQYKPQYGSLYGRFK